MTTLFANLNSHVFIFIYIAFTIIVTITFSLFLSRKECATFLASSPLSKVSAGQQLTFWAVIIFSAFIWLWIVAMPLSYGHRDEIALLTSIIPPTMYSGRFFPLGHMEFNVISLSITNGSLAPLYLLPFLQLLLVLYLIDCIVSPASALIRIYAMVISFMLAILIPFVNLIIPERNAIFLLLISLYLIKRYWEFPKVLTAALAVGMAALSLYYKEPMFAFWVGVAFGFFCYDLSSLSRYSQTKQRQIQAQPLLGSIQLGLFISSVLFLAGYFLFVFYKGIPESFYAGNGASAGLSNRLLFFVRDIPLLSVQFLIGVGAHIFMPRKSFDRSLAVALSIGGLAYSLALIVLSMPLNGYYYSIPILVTVICSAILLKYLAALLFGESWRSYKALLKDSILVVFGVTLIYGLFMVSNSTFKSVMADIAQKKNYHFEYTFLHSELKERGNIKSIYYSPRTKQYNDFATAVLMIFLHKSGIDHQFDIYSHDGCAVWNESYNGGLIRCLKKGFSSEEEYDVIIIENNSLEDLDFSKYRVARLELPFKSHDGSDESILIAKKIAQ